MRFEQNTPLASQDLEQRRAPDGRTVILAELAEIAPDRAVGAGITHIDNLEFTARTDPHGDECGTHAPQCRVTVGLIVHGLISGMQGFDETATAARRPEIGGDRQTTCPLPTAVAAEPISNSNIDRMNEGEILRQNDRLVTRDSPAPVPSRILILLADATAMRKHGELDAHQRFQS